MMKKQKAPEMKKHRKVCSKGDIAFNIVNYTVFFLITLACVFPFYYLFINTISSNELVRLGKIQLYPQEIHFENYVQVMKIEGIADALLVSVARTVLGTLWTVGGCAFLGYLVTKQEMWLRKVWYRLIVITMYFSAGLIPWYMNLRMLGFLDNFWVYVIPGLVSPYNVILVKTFIEGMPSALEESATLDGAGYIRCFVSVVMPLITPILATLCIFSAVGQWNSFTDTMMLMPSGKYYTLQFLLYKLPLFRYVSFPSRSSVSRKQDHRQPGEEHFSPAHTDAGMPWCQRPPHPLYKASDKCSEDVRLLFSHSKLLLQNRYALSLWYPVSHNPFLRILLFSEGFLHAPQRAVRFLLLQESAVKSLFFLPVLSRYHNTIARPLHKLLQIVWLSACRAFLPFCLISITRSFSHIFLKFHQYHRMRSVFPFPGSLPYCTGAVPAAGNVIQTKPSHLYQTY